MTDHGQITDRKALARAKARDVLRQSKVFPTLSVSEQQSIYFDLVQEYMGKPNGNGSALARPFATDSGEEMGYKKYDPGFQGDTRAFKELVDSVDFPKFVADLLKAVFDANLKVMKTQTDSYIKLMKEATKSTADFIKKIKDDDALAKLAESKGDKYNVTTEKNADGSQKLALVNPSGDKVDHDDAEVKKDILETKLAMAKEHRAARWLLQNGYFLSGTVRAPSILRRAGLSLTNSLAIANHQRRMLGTGSWVKGGYVARFGSRKAKARLKRRQAELLSHDED